MVAQYPLVHGVVGAATTKGGNFNTVIYQGDGSAAQAVTGVGFQPDLVWIKNRDQPDSHMIFDALRGATNHLSSDSATVEQTTATSLTSFDADGFTVGLFQPVNATREDYVSWCWLANETASHGSHDGERYNLETGLSIIAYTGNGVLGRNISTSLPSTIKLAIVKKRDASAAGWNIYHSDSHPINARRYYLQLHNDTYAVENTVIWNDTTPTTNLQLGNLNSVNGAGGSYILYAFCDIPEFSQFGHWIGNGSTDGPTVTTGFRPGWLIIKGVDAPTFYSWYVYDSVRDTTNPRSPYLRPDLSNAEGSTSAVDFNEDSFQIKSSAFEFNENGKRYVYACFAEAA